MNETDKELMAAYEITCEQTCVYHYKKYRYHKLQDAVNFARLDSSDGPARHYSETGATSNNTNNGIDGS